MCDDGPVALDDEPVEPSGITRRRLIQAVAATAAGGWLLEKGGWAPPASASGIDGSRAVSMAMHVHSSFSEQSGSMDSQLHQALTNAIDVLWWTDHDYRMLQVGYRRVVHFTSLTNETTDGHPWQWQQRTLGALTASSSGGIVTSPASPNDTIAGGSLGVSAQSISSAPASLGFYAESHPAGWNYRCNLYGQTLTLEVLPASVDTNAYLELLVTTSYHQAKGGRSAGIYSISYRFGGPGLPGTRLADGVQGIVNVPIVPGQWNSISVTPCDDIAALWADMQAHDFASYGLTLSAISTGSLASGYFDYLRFSRQQNTGDVPLQTQQQMMSVYAAAYPSVSQYQGLEISQYQPHINWFGRGVTFGDYTGVTSRNWESFAEQQVASIHAAGGVASYNHPFGMQGGQLLSSTAQDAKLSQVATTLLTNNLLNCDVIEVGYPLRGGCDLAHHLGLWDALSRNGRFLTGNGVNDDHLGGSPSPLGSSWITIKNNWYTSVWSPSTLEPDLVGALRAGRAWAASLPRFRGTLDLVADGTCPMGSVSISSVAQRELTAIATGIPSGGSLQVVRGLVDYAGAAPNAQVIAAYAAGAVATGSVTLAVDTSRSCFARTQVLDLHGRVVALSNPIWLLRESPPAGVPTARAC